jgi:hypothetical protein
MANKSVEAQIICPNIKYLGPIPGFSWHKDTEVTVKIDSNWNPTEQSAIANGNRKWNDFNCSGVKFVDFSEKTYATSEYDNHPPNGFVYWQRIDPQNNGANGGVFHKLDLQDRTIAARIKIHPNLQNTESGTHYIWLGAHEIGHTFNLADCLCANQCSCQGQVSVMSGHGSASFNTDVPKIPCDYDAIDAIYCPTPTPSPTPTPEPTPQTQEECESASWFWNPFSDTCQSDPPPPCELLPEVCENGQWSFEWCGCVPYNTPIVLDLNGNGFDLTNADQGVSFNLNNIGGKEELAWTSAVSEDAWLVLDRNGNGMIEDGTELFGDVTAQPDPPAGEKKNGFRALAEYDKPSNGGNADGQIESGDSVFSSLRLWRDTNHDGLSQPSELHSLGSQNVAALELDYKFSKKSDSHGNQFSFRTKIKDSRGQQIGRWAWDVYLLRSP